MPGQLSSDLDQLSRVLNTLPAQSGVKGLMNIGKPAPPPAPTAPASPAQVPAAVNGKAGKRGSKSPSPDLATLSKDAETARAAMESLRAQIKDKVRRIAALQLLAQGAQYPMWWRGKV